MLKLLITLAMLAQSANLTFYKEVSWWQTGDTAHYDIFPVNQGDYVSIILTCDIPVCGQAGYFRVGDDQSTPIPKLAHGDGTDIFGTFAYRSGNARVYIPVLYRGIEYHAVITVNKSAHLG